MNCQPKIGFTPTEFENIKSSAEAAGMPVAQYIRRRALGQPVTAVMTETDRHAIAQLKQMLGITKQIFKLALADSVLSGHLLSEIVDTIRWVRYGIDAGDEELEDI